MKKLIAIFLIFNTLASIAQIQLEMDTTFLYGMEAGVHYSINMNVDDVIQEPTGNILVRNRRCYNPTAYCGTLHRSNANGDLLPYGFQLTELVFGGSTYYPYLTENGYLICQGTNREPYKVSSNGSITAAEVPYNNNLRNVMRNVGNTVFPYYNPNDGSLISICTSGNLCFFNTTDNIKRFLADGSEDTVFTRSYRGLFYKLRRHGNDLFWSGKIMEYNNYDVRYIVKTDTLGNIDTTFKVDSKFDTLKLGLMEVQQVLSNGKILVTGRIEYNHSSGLIDTLEFFRLHPDGTLDTTFNYLEVGGYREVLTVNGVEELPDGKLLVVGNFPRFGPYPYASIAVLDANGFASPDYLHLPKVMATNPSPPFNLRNASVRGLTRTINNGYLVYGSFDRIDGNPGKGLIKIKTYWPLNTPQNTKTLKTLQIYPNPAQNQVRIDLGNEFKGTQTLNLRDITGKLVKTFTITEPNQTLDIAEVAKGIYLISAPGYKTVKLVVQ